MSDRPPPTSYRDEQGVFHPGPSCNGYSSHLCECAACMLNLGAAARRGAAWARSYSEALPKFLPGPGLSGRALVAAPRSLPARWRRYVSPMRVVCLASGIVGAWLIPVSVGAVLIVLLLVAAAAIRRYVPDLAPVARARRGTR